MRQPLFLLFIMLFSVPAWAETWAFDVFLDQQKMGTHVFERKQNTLISDASFDVKILFINAYRYRHHAEEVWQDNCLQSLKAHTEEKKEITDVRAEQQNNVLRVTQTQEGKNQNAEIEGCVMTFAYWNPTMLQQTRLLNPQNAEYLDTQIVNQGLQTITVRGQTIQAQQYQLTGRINGKVKLNITLWYDQQRWVGLKSITPEGYVVTYKLI